MMAGVSSEAPKFPEPPPPVGGYGCPRCHSPHTDDMDAGPRMGIFSLLQTQTCQSCGFMFNGKTGKSVVLVVCGLLILFYAMAAK